MASSKSKKFAATMGNISNKQDVLSRTSVVLHTLVEGDSPEYRYIQIDNIQLNQNNDYAGDDTEQDIIDLANDIRVNGLLHNIVVSYTEKGEYRLLSGERRLRAYRHLRMSLQDSKYDTIYALVRKNLSPLDEMIILDAANLQTRGGFGNEKKFRKATIRFVDNLKAKFGLSDDLATSLTKQYVNVSEAVIDKNIVIERDLHSALLGYFDSGLISKLQAFEYAKLPQSIQEIISDNLADAERRGASEFKGVNEKTYDAIQQKKNAVSIVTAHEYAKENAQSDITAIEEQLEALSKDDIHYNTLTKERNLLQKQIEQLDAAIHNTKTVAESAEKVVLNPISQPASAISSEVFVNIDKSVKKIESSLSSFDKKSTISKILVLDIHEQQSICSRLQSCLGQLNRILSDLQE